MYVCMYVCTYDCICMYVCMYIYIYVCMYVCMYDIIYVNTWGEVGWSIISTDPMFVLHFTPQLVCLSVRAGKKNKNKTS